MPEAFGLYLVLTDPVAGYERCSEAAVEAGLRYVQLRMKKESREEILETARQVRRITEGSETRFIVNDDVTIAREVDADGVHLGQEDMPIAEARACWPESGKVFGLSTHNEGQEQAAREMAPDYVGVGPIFSTPTKEQSDPTVGIERMAAIIRNSPLTTVAIGGIDAANLATVIQRGAVNFAVVRAVNQSAAPLTAILELQKTWRENYPAP